MLKTLKHHSKNAFPALMQRNFQLYFAGQLLSLIGTWMQMTAEQWLIYPVLTQSKILLGLVGVATNLPTTLLVLFTGVYVDRADKRKILFVTQSLFMIYAFFLSILVWTNNINIWYVLAFALLSGITFAFDMPTRQAFIVETVEEKKTLASAISLNSAAWNMARTIAPPIAGFLIATVGIAICYLFNALSFLAVILSLFLIRLPAFRPPVQSKSLKYHSKEGVFHVKNNPHIFYLFIAIAIFSVFSFSATTLLPVFTHDIFQADEKVFGLLGAALGLGATIGALSFSLVFSRLKPKNLLLGLSFISFVSLTVFAFSTNLTLSLLALVLGGYGASNFIAAINTMVQLHIPHELRGRIMSFYSLVFVGSMPFGSLYAGFTAQAIGAPLTVFIGAAICLVSLLYVFKHLD